MVKTHWKNQQSVAEMAGEQFWLCCTPSAKCAEDKCTTVCVVDVNTLVCMFGSEEAVGFVSSTVGDVNITGLLRRKLVDVYHLQLTLAKALLEKQNHLLQTYFPQVINP